MKSPWKQKVKVQKIIGGYAHAQSKLQQRMSRDSNSQLQKKRAVNERSIARAENDDNKQMGLGRKTKTVQNNNEREREREINRTRDEQL